MYGVPWLLENTQWMDFTFRDFFPIPIFSDTGSNTTKKITSTSHFVIYTLRAHPGHSQRIFREHSLHVWSAAMSQDVLSLFFPKISNIAIFGIFCATKETVRGSKLMGCSFLAPTHPHISATLIRTCLNFVLSAYAWSQKQNSLLIMKPV